MQHAVPNLNKAKKKSAIQQPDQIIVEHTHKQNDSYKNVIDNYIKENAVNILARQMSHY